MARAKTGSIRRWTTIADDLHLPAAHAQRIDRLIRYLRRGDSWPKALTGLERLMTGLQQYPPPIDYPTRRVVGDDLDLIAAAVESGRQTHPTAVALETLIRQFWERFTGGDIAYSPTAIRIDLGTAAYRAYRHLHGVRESDLFHVAHRHLRDLAEVGGPLAWRPGLLPELTHGERSVDGDAAHGDEAELSPFSCF